MRFRVNKPGLFTTVQDLGRTGSQQYGVIVSGAVDRLALRLANLLVGNDETDAALEVTMIGPELVWGQPVLFAIGGADLSPTLDGRPIPLWKTIAAPKGSCLRFGKPVKGCRAYIAVGGGIDVPLAMNSRSTYVGQQLAVLKDGRCRPEMYCRLACHRIEQRGSNVCCRNRQMQTGLPSAAGRSVMI